MGGVVQKWPTLLACLETAIMAINLEGYHGPVTATLDWCEVNALGILAQRPRPFIIAL